MSAYTKNIKNMIHWLINSGIKNRSSLIKGKEGFFESYHTRKKSYSFIYSEISGYALNMLLNLDSWEKNNDYIDIAKGAADFLLESQYKGDEKSLVGAFPLGYDREREVFFSEYYSFDNAMCISGLVDLYKATRAEKYVNAAKQAATWLVDKAQNGDGSFKAMYNLKIREFDKEKLVDSWSGDQGCLHGKNVIALLKLWKITGENKYKVMAGKTCDWVLSLQSSDGGFYARQNEKYYFTHAHCYATEGLIWANHLFKKERYLQAMISSGEWLINRQSKDGALFAYYDRKINAKSFSNIKGIRKLLGSIKICFDYLLPLERTDATAQAMRIWIILYNLTENRKFLDAAQRAAKFLMDTQVNSKRELDKHGGVIFGRRNFLGLRFGSPLMASWSTMFALNGFYFLQHGADLAQKETNVPFLVESLF